MRPAKTATVHVCALRHVPDMVEQTGVRHLVSAIDSYFTPPTPKAVAAERHLRLEMHDIIEARPDATLPARHHVLKLLLPILVCRQSRARPRRRVSNSNQCSPQRTNMGTGSTNCRRVLR